MERTIRLTPVDVLRFAEASGDRNPLHVDEEFARATPYGRPIAHGALVTVAALGGVDVEVVRRIVGLQLQFKHPVYPGESYSASVEQVDETKTRVRVADAGKVSATLTLTHDPESAPLEQSVAGGAAPPAAAAPRSWTIEELAADAVEFRLPYSCDLRALSELASDVGSPGLPPALLGWLAGASYTVGMVAPGTDAVFAGARITRADGEPADDELAGRVTAVDDRTGLVAIDAGVSCGGASATLSLTGFLRPPVPPPTRAAVAEHIAESDALAGRNVLVVGGSRGLGAAIAATLATQGATVWAAFAKSRDRAGELAAEFGPERVRPLQLDAGDPASVAQALERIAGSAAGLDGIVLAAAPPLYEAPLASQTSTSAARFVRDSVALALTPLAAAAPLLGEQSFVVVLSSPVVDEPPEQWPHYAIAKSALEGIASFARLHLPGRVLVVRPPKVWTDSTNTPLGRLGAVSKELVAAAVVGWVTSGADDAVLGPDEIVPAGAEAP